MMQARDASGRQVSLLNDDSATHHHYALPERRSYRTASYVVSQPYDASLTRSASSSPNTPELLRSDSYDSQASSESISPLTPTAMYADYGRAAVYSGEPRSPHEDYPTDAHAYAGPKHQGAYGESAPASHEEEAAAATPERSGKRYPCRYRESHGCDKTFTTSGHASRHSKIHTAEKAVQCTFPSCAKKFTRADNMKQHLETHYKDRARSSGSLAGRRSSSSGKSPPTSSKRTEGPLLPSPAAGGGAWDMRGLNLRLMGRPSAAARTPSSGLDALAMAVACQEGGA